MRVAGRRQRTDHPGRSSHDHFRRRRFALAVAAWGQEGAHVTCSTGRRQPRAVRRMGFLANHAPAFGRRARSRSQHPGSSSDGLPGCERRFGRHERQRDRLRALPLLHAVAMAGVVHGRNRPVEEVSPAGPWRHRQPRLSAFCGSQSDERPCPLGAAPSANHPGLRLPNLRVWTEAGDQLPRIDLDQAPAVSALDHEGPALHDGPQGPAAHVPLVPANHCHCGRSVQVPGLFRNRTQCARGTGR